MRMIEDTARLASESLGIPLVVDRETADRDAVHPFDTGGPLVFPGHIVPRAGGDDFHVGVGSEPFGDVTGMELRPAVDVRAIALDRDRHPHPPSPTRSPNGLGGAGSVWPPPDGGGGA